MTLFCTLTKSLNLTDFDGGTVLGIRSLDGPFIVRTPVDGDPLRHAVAADRLGQGALGGSSCASVKRKALVGPFY
jgi:hypothetical protein